MIYGIASEYLKLHKYLSKKRLYCPTREMGEKTSPSGEDYSLIIYSKDSHHPLTPPIQ